MKGTMNHHGIEWAGREGIVMPPLPIVHQNLKKAVRKSPIPLHVTKQKNKQINKQYIYMLHACVCMCMYACMYVYVCIYMRVWVCMCIFIYVY